MSLDTHRFTVAMPRMRVLFGGGSRWQLSEEMAHLGCARAFVVSGPRGGTDAAQLVKELGSAGLGLFQNAAMHTPMDVTEAALAQLNAIQPDVLVSLGGGSATGLSKALALRTDLPQIVLPTTYAGSEMTSILGETKAGRKTTIRDLRSSPRNGDL